MTNSTTSVVESRAYRLANRKRATSVADIKAFKRCSEAFNVNTNTHSQIQIRLDQIPVMLKQYIEAYDEVETLDEEDIETNARAIVRSEFMELVCDTRAALLELLHKHKRQPSEAANSSVSVSTESMKLRPVSMPKFDGNWQDWSEFKDSFEAMFHNNKKLADVQKFHYLKLCLSGAAMEVVKNIPTTDNYEQAY
ncbi:uncharacterized protein LOC126842317 [Adelges cooleyi]|uniref:uncharacterized protein LOC126842317 n=1 Tax=Adelges cooleyi TaxID=133065 RepID=UPI00217F629D|nr:uncharacterized protein LOC126842317 [Adelges cooleyi]